MAIGWGGVERGLLQYDQDVKDKATLELATRREDRADATLNESKLASRLALLKEYGKESTLRKQSAEELAVSIARLKTLGLPTEVADYLGRSGEADNILASFDKNLGNKTVSKKWIKTLITSVTDSLGDETSAVAVAIALRSSLNSGEDLTTEKGQRASLAQALFDINNAEGWKSWDKAYLDFQKNQLTLGLNETELPKMLIDGNRVDLTAGMYNQSSTEVGRARQQVIKRFAPHVGQIFFTNKQGEVVIDPTKVNQKGVAELGQMIDNATSDLVNLQVGINPENYNDAILKTTSKYIKTWNDYKTDNSLELTPGSPLGQ